MHKYLPRSTEELLHYYERYISPLALIGGFLMENFFLLKRVDLLRTNLIFFFYLIVVAFSIIFLNAVEEGRLQQKWAINFTPFVPLIAQFAFGGLFSGYVSLYSRSASLSTGWVFVLVLALLLLFNERFMRLYTKHVFQISLFFVVLLSFLIFFLPIVFHRIGPDMFLSSAVLSFAITSLLEAFLYYKIARKVVIENLWHTLGVVLLVAACFIGLYFGNFIPPLPLALKDAGVYHNVVRGADGNYVLSGEPYSWLESFARYNTVYHHPPNESVYVFSAIFAPWGLSTTIIHEWQRYDEQTNSWDTITTQSFPINGGRDGGYRGYTKKDNVPAGKWQVNVLTQSGQLIGRIAFTVRDASSSPELVDVIR